MRGRRTSVRATTELCARKTVIPWTIICVFNVGRIRVYISLHCVSATLEMFSMCKCVMYHEWTFMSA